MIDNGDDDGERARQVMGRRCCQMRNGDDWRWWRAMAAMGGGLDWCCAMNGGRRQGGGGEAGDDGDPGEGGRAMAMMGRLTNDEQAMRWASMYEWRCAMSEL